VREAPADAGLMHDLDPIQRQLPPHA
jgi:hypothetical protein